MKEGFSQLWRRLAINLFFHFIYFMSFSLDRAEWSEPRLFCLWALVTKAAAPFSLPCVPSKWEHPFSVHTLLTKSKESQGGPVASIATKHPTVALLPCSLLAARPAQKSPRVAVAGTLTQVSYIPHSRVPQERQRVTQVSFIYAVVMPWPRPSHLMTTLKHQ